MAAVSAWSKPGAWALDAEEHDAAEAANKALGAGADDQAAAEFPSLSAAVASKAPKKKKAQPLSLAEFTTGKPVSHGTGAKSSFSSSKPGLTPDEIVLLPTGPRERTQEELERSSARGFGYSSYGGGRGGRPSGGEDGASRWGGGPSRGSDEPRRGSGFGGGSSRDRDLEPSRADQVDDWGSTKKYAAAPERRERGGGGFLDTQSRADDSESWISNRSYQPPPRERRGGGGFEMFGKEGSAHGGADADTWGKKRDNDPETWGRNQEDSSSGGRRRLVLQPRTLSLDNGNNAKREPNPVEQAKEGMEKKSKGSNPFGAARPREEVLAEKGRDWKEIDEKLEAADVVLQPRTLSLDNGNNAKGEPNPVEQAKEGMEKKNKGSNPFGAARPREEVLAEKGRDWKEIDEKLEAAKIREAAPGENSPSGKKGFGVGNGTGRATEDRTERAWRKPAETADTSPPRENKMEETSN